MREGGITVPAGGTTVPAGGFTGPVFGAAVPGAGAGVAPLLGGSAPVDGGGICPFAGGVAFGFSAAPGEPWARPQGTVAIVTARMVQNIKVVFMGLNHFLSVTLQP